MQEGYRAKMKEAAQKTKDTITTTETNSTAKEGASGHIRKTETGKKKPRPVFVIGHKNPDTDSICSAISYAWLKNQISDTEHLPKRAGNISRETQFVLDHFGVEAPELLTDVRPQIRDIDIRKAPGFDGHMSMREAWEYMRDNVLDTLCVTTENGSLEGLIAVKDIADAYLDLFDTAILGKAHTSYQNLLNTLEGKMLVGDPMGHIHKGRVHVGTSPETMISLISEGDIVLVTNRYEAQMIAIDLGASCMIVCVDSEVPERILEKARQSNCTVITTPYDTFAASRIVSMAAPVKHFMKKDRLLTFDLDLPLEDAMKVMASVRHRYFPVLDEDGQYVGVISRRNLLGMHRKKLILVDHNEKSQAVDGFQEARILEIIDHHRVGSLETSGPVYFRNEPLGCTASILYKMYKENDVEIPRHIAGLLMSAILSDTLLFRSPTCTPFDSKACRELAEIAGEDVNEYAEKMFSASDDLTGRSADDLLFTDFKIFEFGDIRLGAAQGLFMSRSSCRQVEEMVSGCLDEAREKKGLNMFIYMLTNMRDQSTRLLYAGDGLNEVIGEAYHVEAKDGKADVSGMVSRKKQLIPPLQQLIG